jgi:uncharacterized protein (TIGR02687 family)
MKPNDLNLIIDKLTDKYSEGKRVVFWYDGIKGFLERIEDIRTELGKIDVNVHKLEPDGQFRTKYMLEREYPDRKYLIYAPFSKPSVEDNCLEDVFRYSINFNADPAEIMMSDLRIKDEYRQTILDHFNFFKSTERRGKFTEFNEDQNQDEWTERAIYVGMLRVLTNTKSKLFEDVLFTVLSGGLDNNCFIDEFEKYGVEDSFWTMCRDDYGYGDDSPTLKRFTLSVFVTYVSENIRAEVPEEWDRWKSYRPSDVVVFVEKLKTSTTHRTAFINMSHVASEILKASSAFSGDVGDYLECDAFKEFDDLILNWITNRLLDENTSAMAGGKDIPTICRERKKLFFGDSDYRVHYDLLIAAHSVLSSANSYSAPSTFLVMAEQYVGRDYLIDRAYRDFYDAFRKISDSEDFDKLKNLMEGVYNEHLSKQLPAWNDILNIEEAINGNKAQGRFFNTHIQGKEKTAVIISDALRYDVGSELLEELKKDPKHDVELDYMFSSLPAYTQLGMASLLPHGKLEIQQDGSVLSDGSPTNSTEKREAILKKTLLDSRCVHDSKIQSRQESREVFNGTDAVYVYHNQIDIRGKDAMGDEVFVACKEAVKEIVALVRKIRGANVYRIIVTADHGFLFRWEGIVESDKIDLVRLEGDAYIDRRFIISKHGVESEGVVNMQLGKLLGTDDPRILSWPKGPNVFKTRGGQKFVHGGASPQEMIIPLITLKVGRERVESRQADIVLNSTVSKITGLITNLDFFQKESVGEEVVSATYKVYFQADNNEKISNEVMIVADREEADVQKRTFRKRFDFKSKPYRRDMKYWLVIVDEKTGMELSKKEFVMDIPLSSGIGFD